MFLWRFHFTRRQSPLGSFGQIRAATTHRITNAELKAMASTIPSILVATGDWDHLVNPANSRHLVKTMGGEDKVTFAEFKGAGHALQAQFPEELNKELEKCFEKGAKQ
jgi:pimeloyl-ACP methyl ester carboxylesterase